VLARAAAELIEFDFGGGVEALVLLAEAAGDAGFKARVTAWAAACAADAAAAVTFMAAAAAAVGESQRQVEEGRHSEGGACKVLWSHVKHAGVLLAIKFMHRLAVVIL